MDWLTLTIISVVIVSFASVLQTVLMKGDKSNPFTYAITFLGERNNLWKKLVAAILITIGVILLS